jgi:DNA-binding beta-propeller fold protein YncE
LYRPKGIAIDRDGNAWVADGTMGVIQVFQPTGLLLDVVRDEGGKPLKLATPAGIALDQAGRGDASAADGPASALREQIQSLVQKPGDQFDGVWAFEHK